MHIHIALILHKHIFSDLHWYLHFYIYTYIFLLCVNFAHLYCILMIWVLFFYSIFLLFIRLLLWTNATFRLELHLSFTLCWKLKESESESESESFSSSSTDVQIMGTRWKHLKHRINPLDLSADSSFSAPAAWKTIRSLESLGTGTSFGSHLRWKTQTCMCVWPVHESRQGKLSKI